MLNKYEIDVLLSRLDDNHPTKNGIDADQAIKEARNAIAKDVADLKAINESSARNEWPATAKLNELKAQQNKTPFPLDEKNLLDREAYNATLESLKVIQKDYATAKIPAPADITKYIGEIEQKLKNIPTATTNDERNAERDAWQSLTDHNPRAKHHAEMIGKEQARAMWTAAANKLKLQEISKINAKLDRAAKVADPDDKENAVKAALHELKNVAHEQTATQLKEKEVSAIIKEIAFNAQLDCNFQGTEKIPDELIELENIIDKLSKKQTEIATLCNDLNSQPIVDHNELLNQINEKKQESKELAYKLNAWLVKHEKSYLPGVKKTVADNLLKENKRLMYARGYQPPSFLQRANKKDYVKLPTRDSIPAEENLTSNYKDVSAGAYGGIFKLKFWAHQDVQRAYPTVRDTVYIDMSDVTLPLYGKPHSLQEVLINLYGPVGSENFKKHATCHGPNKITLHWKDSADLRTMLEKIKSIDKEHKEALKDTIKITEKPGKDDDDSDVHASLPHP